MIKSSKLLALLIALCLLVSPWLPAAETTAVAGRWPSEQIGSWVGYFADLWGQFTFYRDGRYEVTVFESPSLNSSGTIADFIRWDELTFQDKLMVFTVDGQTSRFRRVSSPYIRLRAESETAAASVDPALAGTYGGRLSGSYIEWTFHEDGRFTQVTPFEEAREAGYYIAGGGELAILLNEKIIKCTYKIRPNILMLDLPDLERQFLQKRTGPLAQPFGFAY